MTEGLHRFYSGNDLHFLTFSCYRRRPLFRNQAYCNLFLKILERVRRRYRLVVLGYVVMPEHVHLLVSEPQRETLSTAIQALKLGLARSWKVVESAVPLLAKDAKSGAPQYQVILPARRVQVDSGRRDFMTSTFDGEEANREAAIYPSQSGYAGPCGFARTVALEQFSLVFLRRGRPGAHQ